MISLTLIVKGISKLRERKEIKGDIKVSVNECGEVYVFIVKGYVYFIF